MSSLAEIIAEGERLERLSTAELQGWERVDFWEKHGPALLAVAKAGRTLAAAVAWTGSCAEELGAFDAAVRGEGKDTTNG